ncbi:MAG: HDOD domain-containing protein [Burkholderiaceae bacterium]|nr:HDOD domain-containing protein [Burkholderiaceae bacterium]
MLEGLFARWRGRRAAAAVAAVPPTRRETPPAPLPAGIAGEPAAHSWLVNRRPLIGGRGGIAGWDLQLSARAADRLQREQAPHVLHQAYWFALAQAAREAPQGGRCALLAAPAAALSDDGFLGQLPPATVVRIDAHQVAALDLARLAGALHMRGVRLATPAAVYRDADFELSAGACPPSASQRPRIAIDLRSHEEVAAAVRSGVAFCCGDFAVAARRPETREVTPATAQAARILSAVIAERPAAEIAALFKQDAALAHRLLRATRAAAFALNRPLASLHEAVLLLGTRELYRWLSVLLMTADSRSAIATALHETALARGRLLEALAASSPRRDPPEHLFVTGAFSLLDLLLGVPLEVALSLAPIPTAAVEALIGEVGPWRPYVEVALAIENQQPERFEAACAALHIPPAAALQASADARRWAAEVVAQLHAPTRALR